jgi:hypothetical protein
MEEFLENRFIALKYVICHKVEQQWGTENAVFLCPVEK